MPGISNKISNIIGVRMPEWIIRQLTTRAVKNAMENRDDNNIKYLVNKSSFVRLISSVDIQNEKDQTYFRNLGLNVTQDPQSIAQQFILFGGTSKYKKENDKINYELRSGIGKDGTYGILGEDEVFDYGYKPMPGITSVKVVTQGKLGSLRGATIEFKVWDKQQLDIIDALYFKLGYSMFLEWGHVNYYDSKDTVDYIKEASLLNAEDISIDPFEKDLDKDILRLKIAQAVRKSNGNYDAMLGIVTNFNFSLTQDGGYNCTLNLQSLGALGDTLRINNAGELPNVLKDVTKKLANTLVELDKQRASAEIMANRDPSNPESYPPCVRDGKFTGKIKERIVPTGQFDTTAAATGQITTPEVEETRLLGEYAYQKVVNGVDYLFFSNYDDPNSGKYQTTGLSTSGEYFCKDNILYIDGRRTDLVGPSYDEFIASYNNNLSDVLLIMQQNGSRAEEFLGDPGKKAYALNKDRGDLIYQVKKNGNEYLAFNKFKVVQPYKISDSTTKIIIDFDLINRKNVVKSTKENSAIKVETIQQSSGLFPYGIESILTLTGNYKSYDNSFLENKEVNKISQNVKTLLKQTAKEISITGAGFYATDFRNIVQYNPLINKLGDIDKTQFNTVILEYPARSYKVDGEWKNLSEKYPSSDKEVYNIYKSDIAKEAINATLKNRSQEWKLVEIKNQQLIDDRLNAIEPIQYKLETKVTSEGAEFYIYITTDDPSIFTSMVVEGGDIVVQNPDTLFTKKEEKSLTGEYTPNLNVEEIQSEQALKYRSALEIILRTLQINMYSSLDAQQLQNIENTTDIYITKVLDKDIALIKDLFSKGVFSDILDGLQKKDPSLSPTNNAQYYSANKDQQFKYNASYGFHSGLMAGQIDLDNNKDFLEKYKVDYNSLMSCYMLPYKQSQNLLEGSNLNHPVYIPFGFFLMILNHCCTLYDSNEASKKSKTPLVYIDYNVESNLCLSNDSMLTTDPYSFMIPFEGTTESYRKIFPKAIKTDKFFDPNKGNPISLKIEEICPFRLPKQVKTGEDAYRGKTMNILVSIDYLLQIIETHTTRDESNSVYFKSMIEEILSDMTKTFGGFNLFRLGYNDSSNCFFISDDQIIPDSTIVLATDSANLRNTDNITEIPIYGKYSIAETFEIKTDISNKLANIIAISANSDIGDQATAGKNGADIGIYNINYKDRYKPVVTAINDAKENENREKKANDSEENAAKQFDNAIKSFYLTNANSQDLVSQAKNYFIDRIGKLKNKDEGTRASAMIPVSINFTTDGFAGAFMGCGFTIDENILPYTYTKNRNILGKPAYDNRVGFVIVGMDHSIDGNRWKTSIRANMFYLKALEEYGKGIIGIAKDAQIQNIQFSNFDEENNTPQTNFIAENNEAKRVAETYLGKPISDNDWTQLIRATYAEASQNQTERAYVMGVILNRVRDNYGKYGASISAQLAAPNQFQSVTGTRFDPGPSDNYNSGPSPQAAQSIYGAAVTILPRVPKTYYSFTSALTSAYGKGTRIQYRQELLNRGGIRIGNTIFA